MSIGPMGMASSMAGVSQSKGSEVERAQQDDAVQQRRTQTDQKAEKAAGIGETAEETEAGDRDADGRRLWENAENGGSVDDDEKGQNLESKDATGDRGTNLDLSG